MHYWRGGGEVDFVVLVEGNPVLIQVSWDGPTERHHRALEDFYEAHARSGEAIFVTAENFESGVLPQGPEG